MESSKFTSKEYFNTLMIFYFALIAGQLLFAAVAYLIYYTGQLDTIDADFIRIFLIISFLIAISAILGNSYIVKLKLSAINERENLYRRLSEYRSVCIIRWAILEAPSFIAIIGFFVSGELLFLVVPILIVAYFIYIRPSSEKVCNDLKLDYNDKMRVLEPESVFYENEK